MKLELTEIGDAANQTDLMQLTETKSKKGHEYLFLFEKDLCNYWSRNKRDWNVFHSENKRLNDESFKSIQSHHRENNPPQPTPLKTCKQEFRTSESPHRQLSGSRSWHSVLVLQMSWLVELKWIVSMA